MSARRTPGSSDFTLIVTILPESDPSQAGHVAVQLGSGERRTVPLKPRHFRVLRILAEARTGDISVDESVRGLRSKAAIARAYAGQAAERARISSDAIRRYVLRIRKEIGSAMAALADEAGVDRAKIPWVIHTRPRQGYRIGNVTLVLIDLNSDKPDDE